MKKIIMSGNGGGTQDNSGGGGLPKIICKEHPLDKKCPKCGEKLKRIAPYEYRGDCLSKDAILTYL